MFLYLSVHRHNNSLRQPPDRNYLNFGVESAERLEMDRLVITTID